MDFLGRTAKKLAGEQPGWHKWTEDRNVKFWAEISDLAEEGKCELLSDTESGRIYLPHFYGKLLEKCYADAEEDADIPFPSEESLNIELPENQKRLLASEYDLIPILEEERGSENPIIKIQFPDGFGSALTPLNMIPRRLTEMAILKIRNYLRLYGNKEYALHKLTPQLKNKEQYIIDLLDQIMIRPMDCYKDIEGGREISYVFWAHFCALVKNDIKKKRDPLGQDIAVFQSACIIEPISAHYKTLAAKRREKEIAFNSLENQLSRPPYLFTLDRILKFTNSKGGLLLGQYTNEELEQWLRKKTTERENNELPLLLIIQGSAKDERCFVYKDKLLPFCARLVAEGRVLVKETLIKQWRSLLLDYKSEAAMNNDEEFERKITKLTGASCPILAALLDDPKLFLVYSEHERSLTPIAVKLYERGELLPLSTLFLLNRKELNFDAKITLPFWYSMPVLTAIISFFKGLAGKKKAAKAPAAKEEDEEEVTLEWKDRSRDIKTAAEELELFMVPSGYTLKTYMEELEARWSRLLDLKARKDLVIDVKSLIRDNLRRTLKVEKQFKPSQEKIRNMAENIINRNPALSSLSGKDSLTLYTELYLVKLLQEIK